MVSKDDNPTKAHARFLEGQLIQMAKQAGAVKLANGTAPDFAKLPEADRADMAFFIEQMRTVLSILDFDLFRSPGGARCPSPERTGTLPSSSSMRSASALRRGS